MVLGAIWCPLEKVREISVRIREIKKGNGLSENLEIKWTKISPAKSLFYRNVIDYFFDDDDLYFRCLVVPDKSLIDHTKFGQDHNTWYYKMYFDMLKVLLIPSNRYRIYLDIKDTCGGSKVLKLQDVLCNNIYDFSHEIIEKIQIVRSHEIELLQLADVLIGAMSYINRGLKSSLAKLDLIERIKQRSGYSLTKTTLVGEKKFNILIWRSAERC